MQDVHDPPVRVTREMDVRMRARHGGKDERRFVRFRRREPLDGRRQHGDLVAPRNPDAVRHALTYHRRRQQDGVEHARRLGLFHNRHVGTSAPAQRVGERRVRHDDSVFDVRCVQIEHAIDHRPPGHGHERLGHARLQA